MKKNLILLFMLTSMAFVSKAQISGSTYSQTFDGLSTGLPTGWRVDTMVNPNAGLGNNAINRFSATQATWNSTSRGFKNVASADGLNSASTSTAQNASTDRALAVRQVSASGWDDHDTLVSFNFGINNTVGLSNFSCTFKLMSLHTGITRSNNWIVQYALGTTPTAFTTVTTTPATLTGSGTFGSTTVTANFGASLNNQSQPVWIRICPTDSTIGSGSRPLVGIDDFDLTWTGTAVNNTPQVTNYIPVSGAINVPTTTTNLTINFDKPMIADVGNVTLKNLTDATQIQIPAANCTAAGTSVTIPGVTLLAGKNYAVRYDSTCFRSNGYPCIGVYDDLTWVFSTTPAVLPPVNSLNETYTGCTNTAMGLFKQQSVDGTQTWRCSNFGRTDSFAVYMNGGSATESFDNEDWLVSPLINVSAMTHPYLHFWTKRRFSGNNVKEVFVSSNYTNDVNTATWGAALIPNMSTLDSNNWNQIKNNSLLTYKTNNFTIGFSYKSTASPTPNAEEWTIDDVQITDGPLSVSHLTLDNVDMYVAQNANFEQTQLVIVSEKVEELNLILFDQVGNVVMKYSVNTRIGKNMYWLPTSSLSTGIYFIQASNASSKGITKFMK